jgi:hypothetical protein
VAEPLGHFFKPSLQLQFINEGADLLRALPTLFLLMFSAS